MAFFLFPKNGKETRLKAFLGDINEELPIKSFSKNVNFIDNTILD